MGQENRRVDVREHILVVARGEERLEQRILDGLHACDDWHVEEVAPALGLVGSAAEGELGNVADQRVAHEVGEARQR